MANVAFNVALGRLAYYASLPAASDAIVAVPLEATGLEGDATIIDHNTLAEILAGSSNEQTTAGRITLTGVTEAVDDVNNRVNMDSDNIVWSGIGTSAAVGAVVLVYVPIVGTSTDADMIPLGKYDVTWTPDGNDFTLTVNDWARAVGV